MLGEVVGGLGLGIGVGHQVVPQDPPDPLVVAVTFQQFLAEPEEAQYRRGVIFQHDPLRLVFEEPIHVADHGLLQALVLFGEADVDLARPIHHLEQAAHLVRAQLLFRVPGPVAREVQLRWPCRADGGHDLLRRVITAEGREQHGDPERYRRCEGGHHRCIVLISRRAVSRTSSSRSSSGGSLYVCGR